MTLLGLVAMPKAGKGVVVDALKTEGWTPISMSGILKQHMIADKLPWVFEDKDSLSRVSYHRSAIYYRKRYHPGILAQWSLDAARTLSPEKRDKVIIDGIRNPSELEYLRKHARGNSHFWGIVASEDPEKDREIRRHRLEANRLQRGEGYEAVDDFDWLEYLEQEIAPYGSQVGECLRIVSSMKNGEILVNGGLSESEKNIWQDEVRKKALRLEEVSSHPEIGF